jgi:hypothetical protein
MLPSTPSTSGGDRQLEITLYTHEKQGAGLTLTNVLHVKGVVELQIVTEVMNWKVALLGNQSASAPVYQRNSQKNTPAAGKADLLLRIAEQEINLCRCEGGVAVVVLGTETTATIYWVRAGQCYKIERDVMLGATRGKIEACCCPEQELPPEIPSVVSCIG